MYVNSPSYRVGELDLSSELSDRSSRGSMENLLCDISAVTDPTAPDVEEAEQEGVDQPEQKGISYHFSFVILKSKSTSLVYSL